MPPYLTCISLTSTTGDDHRSIDLIPGTPCVIGRTSKSKVDMEARTNNALFDCAVISRQHAEIRSSPWAASGAQITLIDLKSLHGTTVNGRRLTPHAEFTLKSGDVIKFGERVSRGEEAHDGVSVTFRHLHQHDSHPEDSQCPASSRTARGYRVPDDSDQSEFDSDIESAGSCVDQIPSAETTPEQHKMGTQSQPIDLDEVTAAHKKVISLLDEDELIYEGNQGAIFTPAVPETINLIDDEPMLPAEPSPIAAVVPPTFYNLHESDFDDAHEGVTTYNTGLSKILNERALDDEQSIPEEDQGEDDDNAEYVGHATEQELDLDSLDGSPTLSEDEMDDYEPEYISQRLPSEELGQPNALAVTSVWMKMQEDAVATPKPHYDPIRGSRPAAEDPSTTTAPPQPSKYTRRWDIPPVMSQDSSHGPTLVPLPSSAPFQPTSTVMQAENQSHIEQSESRGPPTATLAATEFSRGKLAIGNLLQPQSQNTAYQLPHSNLEDSASRYGVPQPLAPNSTLTTDAAAMPDATAKSMGTNKRKALDAFDIEVEHSAEPAAKKVVTVDASTGTQRAIATRSSNKNSVAQRVVGAVVKHAISAGVGVAATIAFLNSTYAERVIEYLG